MVKVKICGLTRPCDIEAVNESRPEFIGFVFAESRRKVTFQQALDLRRMLRPEIVPVGVFVNETVEKVASVARSGAIEAIQLHGAEDEAYLQRLKTLTGMPIIKAIAIQKAGDAQMGSTSAANYLLLDSKGGGTGKRFDWDLIGQMDRPFFLAGGLNPANVTEAIEKTRPFAVDVSGGVETDGLKDAAKIHELIKRVRDE